jgi:hypothetical protein
MIDHYEFRYRYGKMICVVLIWESFKLRTFEVVTQVTESWE